MRVLAALLAIIVVVSPFAVLPNSVVEVAEAGSVPAWTRVFHLHDSGTYIVHPHDWLNSSTTFVQSNWDYDNDGLDGVSIRKNVPPQRWHHWILAPSVNKDVILTGDLSASVWARSRGNDSGTIINAIFFDAGPGEWSDPALWTEIGRNDVPLNGPFYADFQRYAVTLSGVSYTLLAGHSLVLTLQRGDSHNDWLIIMYDRSSMDSYVTLTTTTFISVDNAFTQDSVGLPRSTFSDLEDPVLVANVSNPFGAYEIVGATASVSYAGNGTVVVYPFWMTLNLTDPSSNPSWVRFQSTLPRLQAGLYVINVTSADPQGSPSWLTASLTIVTVDHFQITAPSSTVAGEYFRMNITAMDASNGVVSDWVGLVQLDAFAANMTWPGEGELSNTSVVFTLADSGRIVNMSQSYDFGEESIRIRASDGLHVGWSEPISIHPGPVDNVTISPGDNQTVAAGNFIEFTVTATDSLGNTNTSWEPYWEVQGSSGYISWTGIDGCNVTFTASAIGFSNISCTDNATAIYDSVKIEVSVGALYRIVISSPRYPLSIGEAESQVLNATGYDSYGNTVDISGATWDTTTTGSLVWAGPSATYTAGYIPETGVIRCRLNSVVGALNVIVQTSPNGPWFSDDIPAQSRLEDSGSWQQSLANFWHHKNGTTDLTWWVEDVNTTLYFISHNPSSNAILEFYTQRDQSGEDNFRLWVVDPQGFRAYKIVTVDIDAVNDPPLFVNSPPGTLYVKFDTSYTFNYTYYVTDIDNPKSDLVLTAVYTQDGTAVPSIYFNGLIATFLFPKQNGEQSYFNFVTMRLSDKVDSSSFDTIVWVTTDTPPELNQSLPDPLRIDEGQMHIWQFNLDMYFFDSDEDALYFTNGFEHIHFEINQTSHDVYLSAPEEWSGTTEGVFMATDPTGALKTDSVTVIVTPVNDPPVVSQIEDIHVKYDSAYFLYISHYVLDPDNSLDSLIYVLSDPHVTHSVSMTGAHRLEILFPPSLSGPSYTGLYDVDVYLTVTDPYGSTSGAQKFTVWVSDNSPPEVISESVEQLIYSFPEDSWLNDTIRTGDLFRDLDDDQLTLSISGYTNIHPVTYPNGVVNLTAGINWSGIEVLTIKAVDPHGAWASIRAYVTVTEVDDSPFISPIPDKIIKGGPRNFRIVVTQYLTDSDDVWTNLTIECSPTNAIYVDGFLYISLPNNADVITVTIWASEGTLESNKVDFRVGISKTMGEKIGWPYSFPLVLLASAVGAYFLAMRIPRPYELENLFLIHNDGRLVAHVTREEATNLDKDVVSAMFTAVQEFVRDSFQKGEVGLKKLEIGDSNVVIEKGTSAYLALIYSGWPQKDTFDTLTMLLRDIEERYKDMLSHWNGTAKTVKGVDKMLQDFMVKDYTPGAWQEEEKIAEEEWVDILSKEA
jgi:hypothetical protein